MKPNPIDLAALEKAAKRTRRAEAAVELLKALAVGLLLSSPLIYQIVSQLAGWKE